MEELSRIVAASMVRHGCDTAVDPRRLAWSPWFRCELNESLLLVPSAPGIVALAEEVGILGAHELSSHRDREKVANEGTGAPQRPAANEGSAARQRPTANELVGVAQRFSAAKSQQKTAGTLAPEGIAPEAVQARRLLAVFEIAEANDLGAALIQLFAPGSPLRDRLRSGRCFARFTPVADPAERRTASAALREWLTASMQSEPESGNSANGENHNDKRSSAA